MTLYKYRNLENIKNLIDIFLNQRLYAAAYTNMNDPMEGHYFYRSGEMSAEFKSALKGEKDSFGICSLSEIPNNNLMWSHYANGYNGIAIGVEIDRVAYDVKKVVYGELSKLTERMENSPAEAAKQVLSRKLEIWDYEKEHRVFVPNDCFVTVKITDVIFGRRVSRDDKAFFKGLIDKLHPGIHFSVEDEVDELATA